MASQIFRHRQQPLRRKRVRFPLRRRILLITLLASFVPALLTLSAATIYALRAIRTYAVDQAKAAVFTAGERLGDRIQRDAAALREIAHDSRHAAPLAAVRRNKAPDAGAWNAFAETLLQSFSDGRDREFFLVGPRGAFHPLLPLPASPSPGKESVVTSLLTASLEVPRPAVVAFEDRTAGPRPEPELWIAASIPTLPDHWLALRLAREEMLADLGSAAPDDPSRLFVLSSRYGSEATGRAAEELRFLTGQMPDVTPGVYAVPGNNMVQYAVSRAGALANLSRPTGRESSLYLARRVDLDAASASLFYGVWRIMLFGIVFGGLIGAISFWLSRRLVEPIMQLKTGFQRLETGDLEYRVRLNTGDELEQLADSANQMAATLQKTYRTLADKLLLLDEKARQLTLTYDLAKTINYALEMAPLLRSIVGEMGKIVSASQVAVALLDEDGRRFRLIATLSGRTPASDGESYPLGGSLTEQALLLGKVIVFPLSPSGPHPEEQLLAGANSLCVVPLTTPDGPIGAVLLADAAPEAFGEQEVELLERLSPMLATAVDHGRLYERQGQFANELERQVAARTEELADAQRQLVQVEKFAAAGELAANIAHEINNPLGIIKNHLKLIQGQTVRRELGPEELAAFRETLAVVEEEIDRIARITNQMRQLNSPVNPRREMIPVNHEVDLIVGLFRQTFHQKQLDIRTSYDPALGNVSTVSDFLRQILINLLRNAHDAAPVGGWIHLETLAGHPCAASFSLRVTDNGPGIRPEHLTRIFDPFYTTKKEGKGTGLGLSVSYGLARQMGGTLRAGNAEGAGAAMTLELPLHGASNDDTHPGDPPSASGRDPVRREGGRIIIG